jgi:hypothetical protein
MMATVSGVPGRSGGANRLTVATHHTRGTFRKHRHARQVDPPADVVDVPITPPRSLPRGAAPYWRALRPVDGRATPADQQRLVLLCTYLADHDAIARELARRRFTPDVVVALRREKRLIAMTIRALLLDYRKHAPPVAPAIPADSPLAEFLTRRRA